MEAINLNLVIVYLKHR